MLFINLAYSVQRKTNFNVAGSQKSSVGMPFVLCRAEIFVDATRAMSVVTGEKDNKQVEDKIKYSD